jgi:HNH endonuclease
VPPVDTDGGDIDGGDIDMSPRGDRSIPWAALLADGDTVRRYRSHILRRAPDNCWWWTSSISDTGHGSFRAGSHTMGTSRPVPAHLYGYRLAHGAESIPRGMVVRHICDEPPCQNPAHWMLGTRGDNNRDAASRRRLAGHALADVRGAAGRARAVRAAILAAAAEDLDEAIAAALAAGNPRGEHQDALF